MEAGGRTGGGLAVPVLMRRTRAPRLSPLNGFRSVTSSYSTTPIAHKSAGCVRCERNGVSAPFRSQVRALRPPAMRSAKGKRENTACGGAAEARAASRKGT